MVEVITTAVSVVALAVSMTTAWLTLFRRGTVEMTQPTVIYFGPDGPWTEKASPHPKVYLRALLFATSKRGRVIESMHVSLARNETRQNFNIWVHGDERLVRGSGLFIGQNGIGTNHHFLMPEDGTAFQFSIGRYVLDVYARLLGDRKPKRLFSQELDISSEIASSLQDPTMGLYFDWGPDSARYLPHVSKQPALPDSRGMIERILSGMPASGQRDLTPADPSDTPPV